jgi:hypothetical protein
MLLVCKASSYVTSGCVKFRSYFVFLLTVHLVTVFVNNQPEAQFFFLCLFIPVLYMFRATKLIIRSVSCGRIDILVAYHTVTYIQ